MDLSSSIIGAILLAVCVLPLVLLGRKSGKKEKVLLRMLQAEAQQEGCIVNTYEFSGDCVIGLDETANQLFFAKKTDKEESSKSVKLNEIQNCRLITTGELAKNTDSSQRTMETLGLAFRSVKKETPEFTLEFFNTQDSIQLNGELQLAEKWVRIVNTRVPKLQKVK